MRSKDVEITIRTKTEGKGFDELLSQLKAVQKETKLTTAQLAELGKNASASSAYFGRSDAGNLLIKAFQQSLSIAQSISVLLGGGANEVLTAFQRALNVTMSIVETIKTIQSLISIFGFLGFAGGGYVPGAERSDSVPAMLTPGEFVISKDSVSRFGAGFFAMLNRGWGANRLNRYASGGMVKPGGNIILQLSGDISDYFALKVAMKGNPQYNLRVQKAS